MCPRRPWGPSPHAGSCTTEAGARGRSARAPPPARCIRMFAASAWQAPQLTPREPYRKASPERRSDRALAMMPPMPASTARPHRRPPSAPVELWSILRSAFEVRRDPVPFCRQVSGRVVRYLSQRGALSPGARALDAGAGGGALAEALAAGGARVVGLDVQDYRQAVLEHTPFVVG